MKKSVELSIDETKKVLEPLGFVHVYRLIFRHPILDETFDFSACSIEGIPYVIFNQGVDSGVNKARTTIRKMQDNLNNYIIQ